MMRHPAIRHLLALGVLAGVLVSGSSVLAAEAAAPSGVVIVSPTGVTRSLGVTTFPRKLTLPVVDLSLSPSGRGYATLDVGGTITSYGDAARFSRQSFPRTGAIPAAIVLTQTGRGAYVGFIDGTVRALGDAQALVGSPANGQSRLIPPLVDIALAPDGEGVWALRSDGSVAELGGATALPDTPASSPAVGIAATPTGMGAWVARLNGSVVALGDAQGERGPRGSSEPRVTDIASLGPDGWALVDLAGRVEARGASPAALPGSGGGFVAIDSLAATSAISAGGDGAPTSTKVITPPAVLGTSGDPAGSLDVSLPCYITGGATPLQAGDVLAASIGEHTPNGLLRRILSVGACSNEALVVATEPATLSDAIPEGEIDLSNGLSTTQLPDIEPTTEDGFIEPNPTPIVSKPVTSSTVSTASSSAAAAGAVGTVADPGRFTYGCPSDPDGSAATVKLKATPSFSFDPEVTFSADWDSDSANVQIGLGLQGDLNVDLSATGTIACDATFALINDRSLGTKVLFVGPVPVVVEPKLNLKAKLAGQAELAVSATASATGSVSAVASISGPAGSISYNSSSLFTGTTSSEISGKLTAGFTLEPSLGFVLYGVVAPQVAGETGLTATLDPCSAPNLKLEQPAKLSFTLEPAGWLKRRLDPVGIDLSLRQEFQLPGSPYLLYSTDAPIPTPPICDEQPTTELPEGTVGQPYSTQLTIPIPDGTTLQSYALTPGSTLPAGLNLSSTGQLTGTPTQSGIHTFSVTADHSGGSADGLFELTILADSLRITTDSLPGARLDQPYSFVLQANRPANELVWTIPSGTLPNGITLDPDGTLAGTPTEAGFFSFTVRLQHAPPTGGGGTVETTLSLSVNGDAPIVFVSTRDGGRGDIYVMNADGSGQTRLTNSPESIERDLQLSPDGTKVAFVRSVSGEPADIWVVNLDGSGLTRLTETSGAVQLSHRHNNEPNWSPDGTRVVFTSLRDGGKAMIYVVSSDGTGLARLTINTYTNFSPAWSPDGSTIAFTSYRPDASGGFSRGIFVMNPDGSDQTRLTSGPWAEHPAWSPDSRQIAYRAGSTEGLLYAINADGSGNTNVSNAIRAEGFDWSSDGKIAFDQGTVGRNLFTVNSDGSALTQLTDVTSGYHVDPVWSPDASRIVFTFLDSGNQIYVMNADGSNRTRLTTTGIDNYDADW